MEAAVHCLGLQRDAAAHNKRVINTASADTSGVDERTAECRVKGRL